MATADEVGNILRTIAPACANPPPITADTVRVYALLLGDFDVALLRAAALAQVAANKYFPAVAELRDACARLATGADELPSPDLCWGEVLKAVRLFGWPSPEKAQARLDPDLWEAIERGIGGWVPLCNSEDEASVRMRFIRALEAVRRRKLDAVRSLPQLAGGAAKKLRAGD